MQYKIMISFRKMIDCHRLVFMSMDSVLVAESVCFESVMNLTLDGMQSQLWEWSHYQRIAATDGMQSSHPSLLCD